MARVFDYSRDLYNPGEKKIVYFFLKKKVYNHFFPLGYADPRISPNIRTFRGLHKTSLDNNHNKSRNILKSLK